MEKGIRTGQSKSKSINTRNEDQAEAGERVTRKSLGKKKRERGGLTKSGQGLEFVARCPPDTQKPVSS